MFKKTWQIVLFAVSTSLLWGVSLTPTVSAALIDDFVITVKTDNTGASTDTQFVLPTFDNTNNYNIDCNNDGVDEATAQTSSYICDYGPAGLNTGSGTYTIRIKDNTGGHTGFKHI